MWTQDLWPENWDHISKVLFTFLEDDHFRVGNALIAGADQRSWTTEEYVLKTFNIIRSIFLSILLIWNWLESLFSVYLKGPKKCVLYVWKVALQTECFFQTALSGFYLIFSVWRVTTEIHIWDIFLRHLIMKGFLCVTRNNWASLHWLQ